LEQVNSVEDPEWKLWEQPDTHRSRGRLAFHAAIAARNQGEPAFLCFHHALLTAKHEQGKDHGKRQTLLDAARAAELDLERFERDLADRSFLAQIGADYEAGHDRLGVFGTPTFVFPNAAAAYLKLDPNTPVPDPLVLFDDLVRTVRDRPYLAEIKRPRKA